MNPSKVIGMLLNDGWHEVQAGTLTFEPLSGHAVYVRDDR